MLSSLRLADELLPDMGDPRSPERNLESMINHSKDGLATGFDFDLVTSKEAGVDPKKEDTDRLYSSPELSSGIDLDKLPDASSDAVKISHVEFDKTGGGTLTLEQHAKGECSVSPSPVKTPLEESDRRIESPCTRKRSSSPSRMDSPKRRGSSLEDPLQKRLSTSPRRRDSSSRTKKRSASPSSVPRRDSPGYRYKNDRRRYRSRSKSPRRRGHRHRRSPSPRRRQHKSPRRRSPSPRGTRSLRKRNWSPLDCGSTGVGKPGKNLFVAGFSFVTTERDLEKKFSKFGRVADARIVRDKRSGDSRGFGFLSLERDEEADAAIRALDKTEWNGRVVLVEKAKTCIR